MIKLPYEVEKLVQKEVNKFKGYTFRYINESYQYGPSDLLLRFFNGNLQIIGNNEAYNRRELIRIRSKLLASVYADLCTKYGSEMLDIDLVVPACLSDTTDVRFQQIPCLTFSRTVSSNNILIPSVDALLGYRIHAMIRGLDTPLFNKKEKGYKTK